MPPHLALAADHGGFSLKDELAPWLRDQGFEVEDLGANSLEPADDYVEAFVRDVNRARVLSVGAPAEIR